ncbi:hypothetical protein MHB85_23385 [Paenibacillus sp. FSL K6-4396]|uniref:hypothetical protein n=1 Tax=unclassified Paenibacillus TaxID=185978 RepID=UPI00177B67B0|nr:hypothetical protein [Paenibacillus sp. CFBP 13594]MBD8839130.1 hypothetical protein [Paenibacillus sp. CFBP 13594]
MKKFLISTALIMTVSAVTALSIYAGHHNDDATADNPNYPDFGPGVKLSEEEINRALENVSGITTSFGTFKRVTEKDPYITEKETVDNLDHLTADTKQIFSHGNYFVKSDSEE